MNKKLIVIFLLLMAGIIVVVVTLDLLSERPDKRAENPFEYNVVKYKSVDSTLVKYKETKNIMLNTLKPKGMAYMDHKLYLISDSALQIITLDGIQVLKTRLPAEPTCIIATSKIIYIGFRNFVASYDLTGKLITSWSPTDQKSLFTSIAVKENLIFVADAGNRRVLRYTPEGKLLDTFNGKSSKEDTHGFIIPSPYFDMAFNPDGELWIVNPGKRSLEQYLDDGTFRTFWNSDEVGIEGFWGCCNPAHFTFLPDGSFVTSEKNNVRIKVYKPSGEFDCVVAPTEKFPDEETAPELAVTQTGDIYVLDFEKNIVRLFQHK